MTPPSTNPLGKTSLALGIASSAFVFGLGLCGLIGGARLPGVAQLLFVCGASSAFLGLIAALVGAGGLFGKDQRRAPAIIGMLLGLGGLCLFLVLLNAVGQGG